jgi:xylan 1,4-beta-xylosidase
VKKFNKNADLYFKKRYVKTQAAYGMQRWDNHQYQNIPDLISAFEAERWPLLLFEYKTNNEFTIPYHWHDWYEIIYVHSGEIDVYVENTLYKLKEESFIYFPSGVMHKTVNSNNSRVMILHIQYEYIRRVLPEWEDVTISLDKILKDNKIRKYVDRIEEILLKLEDVYNDEVLLAQNGAVGLLVYLFYEIAKCYGREKIRDEYTTSQKYKERLLHIFNYVEDHLTESFTLGDLANDMSVSPQYLSKIFKKHLSTTFTKYVDEKRLERVLNDLIYSDITLTDLALDAGFPNYNSFVRACREKYNMTPNEYRKKYQPNSD